LFAEIPGLLPQIFDLLDPERPIPPPGKLVDEPAIVSLPRPPREKVDDSHESQRFHQRRMILIEGRKLPVSLEKHGHLPTGFVGVVRQEQPEILHRRSHHHIVEIDQQKSLVGAIENVSPVAVSVQPMHGEPSKERPDPVDSGEGHLFKLVPALGVHHFLPEKLLHVRSRPAVRIEAYPFKGVLPTGDGMGPPDDRSEPEKVLVLLRIEAAPSPSGEQSKRERHSLPGGRFRVFGGFCPRGLNLVLNLLIRIHLYLEEGVSFPIRQGSHYRHLRRGQLLKKAVFFENSLVRPSSRSVELGHKVFVPIGTQAVHAVYVARVSVHGTVEREIEKLLHRRGDQVWSQHVETAGCLHHTRHCIVH
jgi:hypothetical protein